MTGLHSIWINIYFPILTAARFSVYLGLWRHLLPGVASDLFAKPWKPIPDSHSCCQCPLWQLWYDCIHKTSHGIQSGSLNHGGRVLASPAHYEASDEFITSVLTNGFERRVWALLEARWRQQKPGSPSQPCLRCCLASPRLDSSAWWKRWGEWTLCYELINATEINNLGSLLCTSFMQH